MELRHLRYFVAVAEERHFGRAASRLGISAPTLTTQIQSLEAKLQARLLDRGAKRVELTHAGERFLREAMATLRQAEIAEQIGRQAGRGQAGTLRVGYALTTSLMGLLPAAIAEFRKANPEVQFELRRTETLPTIRDISDGYADLGILRSPEHLPSGISGFKITEEDFCVALPEGHPLAGHEELSADMLNDFPFVSTALESEVSFWNNFRGSGIRSVVARATDVVSVLTLVAGGVGITVLPTHVRLAGVPGVAFRRIRGGKQNACYSVVFRSRETSPLVKLFVGHLRAMKKSDWLWAGPRTTVQVT